MPHGAGLVLYRDLANDLAAFVSYDNAAPLIPAPVSRQFSCGLLTDGAGDLVIGEIFAVNLGHAEDPDLGQDTGRGHK